MTPSKFGPAATTAERRILRDYSDKMGTRGWELGAVVFAQSEILFLLNILYCYAVFQQYLISAEPSVPTIGRSYCRRQSVKNF